MTDPSSPFGEDPLEEHVVASEVIHRGRYLEVRIDTIERADGTRGTRDVVGHPGAVAILALDADGRLLLVRQWRIPTGHAMLEIPAGTLDVHDGVTEDPDGAARRELEEETGHRASTWRKLAAFWTAPGFASELMHLYLATGIAGADGDDRLVPDEDERLELRHVTVDEALALVEDGSIADAKSILGILWLDRLRRAGELPSPTADEASGAGAPVASRPIDSAAVPPPPSPPATPAGESVSIRYGYTPTQFSLAYAALARRQRSSWVMAGLFAVLTVLNLVTLQDPVTGAIGVVFGLGFASGLFTVPFVWFSLRRKGDLFRDLVATFDDRGLTSTSPITGGTLAWSGIEQIQAKADWLFVRSRVGSAVPLPRNAFTADELRRVERIALRHGLTLDGHRVEPAAR
jgi:ADP-ribose pyrophosphatase